MEKEQKPDFFDFAKWILDPRNKRQYQYILSFLADWEYERFIAALRGKPPVRLCTCCYIRAHVEWGRNIKHCWGSVYCHAKGCEDKSRYLCERCVHCRPNLEMKSYESPKLQFDSTEAYCCEHKHLAVTKVYHNHNYH